MESTHLGTVQYVTEIIYIHGDGEKHARTYNIVVLYIINNNKSKSTELVTLTTIDQQKKIKRINWQTMLCLLIKDDAACCSLWM
jgi:hypothetical protein